MECNPFKPLTCKSGVNISQPIARETIEVWDPIQKCKVIRYKDELLKELYRDLTIDINPKEPFEFVGRIDGPPLTQYRNQNLRNY
ncbi:hypothetical protein ACWOAH_09940 [Vagococcus vulneris]|uniref:Uncharacterized protein n=1 Tax=Vagococcus vulneris TaxID=1977869 RepID=A0A429ZWT9_9ENTE|nr:hypothetical protein [Vagococcus vulneris]RST98267.1 hypothetical protein CBF37_08110 [Vagococcus vulneris]